MGHFHGALNPTLKETLEFQSMSGLRTHTGGLSQHAHSTSKPLADMVQDFRTSPVLSEKSMTLFFLGGVGQGGVWTIDEGVIKGLGARD